MTKTTCPQAVDWPSVYRTWGRNVAARRADAGISQHALARAVGVASCHICLIEQGRRGPGNEIRYQISNVLGCRVEDLFPYPDATATP